MSAISCVAVVPVKPLDVALGRLTNVLSGAERAALQSAMLRDVLRACRSAAGLSRALVVTADAEVSLVACAEGAVVVDDYLPPRGMNPAVRRGLDVASEYGATAALVVTADVPMVRAAELTALAQWPEGEGCVVLVPSRDGTGTNAMLLRPPGVLDPELGPHSFARHTAQARRRGVASRCAEFPGIALDIDTPADLLVFLNSGVPCVARHMLDQRGALAAVGSSR